VSILRRPATQPLSLRWGFETTSKEVIRLWYNLAKDIVARPAGQKFSAPSPLTAIRFVARKICNCNNPILRSHPISCPIFF